MVAQATTHPQLTVVGDVPMIALDVRVDWALDHANAPTLEFLVARLPSMDRLRYEQRGPLYYAEAGGFVDFFLWHGKPDRGYGGDRFPITMVDGSEQVLVGPWRPASWQLNSAGFGPCLEVRITDVANNWERGSKCGGAVSLAWAQSELDALQPLCPGVTLYQADQAGAPHYQPTLRGYTPQESKAVVRAAAEAARQLRAACAWGTR